VVAKPELGRCLVAVLTTVTLIVFPTISSAAIVFGPRTDYPAGFRPSSIAVADVNGDGHADVVVTNQFTNTLSVLLGNAGGTLDSQTTYDTGLEPVSVASGDLNQDGRQDVVTADKTSNTVSISLGNGDGSFSPHQEYPVANSPRSVALSDVDGDAVLDVVVACAAASGASVLLGRGDGTFLPRTDLTTAFGPESVVLGDFNEDGLADFAAACVGNGSGGTVSVLLGSGDGSFASRRDLETFYGEPSLSVADVDKDGHQDLVVCTGTTFKVSVFKGCGDGTFGLRWDMNVADDPTSMALADFDGDGILDLAVSIPDINRIAVFRGAGDGTYNSEQDLVAATTPVAVGAGDFGDGPATDLVVANYGSTDVSLFLNRADRPPIVVAPLQAIAAEGSLLTVSVSVSDPDGDAIESLSSSTLPLGATFQANPTHTAGTLSWTPDFTQAGTYNVVFTASNAIAGMATTQIIITELNRAPVANPGGPYTGVAGIPIHFNGSASSDPDGNALSYLWDYGDLMTGAGATPDHTYTAGGTFTVELTVTDNGIPPSSGSASTTATVGGSLDARIFVTNNNRTIRLGSGKPTWCADIEPIGGAFELTDIVLNSVVLKYGGDQILALARKTSIISDVDGNGIAEIGVCFSKDTIRSLFVGLPNGRSTVSVAIDGTLVNGAKFSGSVQVDVVSSGSNLAASLSPNPLNPGAVLTFTTEKPGPVRVRLYDTAGRLVRTLADIWCARAGYYDVRVDGRSDDGRRLSSGAYFYRVEAAEGEVTGRLVILR
jgi:hypothetical protein